MTLDKVKGLCYESFPRNNAVGGQLSHSVWLGMRPWILRYRLRAVLCRTQVQQQIYDLIHWHSQFQWREFVMGMCWIVLLLSFKELGRRVK